MTPTTARLALVTCGELPDLDQDNHALRDALTERGIAVDAVVWDDQTVDWATYSHAVIRSTWDYTERPAQFVDWTRKVERTSTLLNPAAVVGWNIDKHYLRDLETAGLPIVPTIWLDPERNFDSRAIHTRFPAFGDFVVKPTVSAGARDTGRYNAGVTQQRSLAITHARNLLVAGRRVMIQRYLRNVDTAGETALVYMNGEFSHSVRKGALLDGPYREGVTDELFRRKIMVERPASDAERVLADRVVAALPDVIPGVDGPLLYARVDLIPDDDGAPVVLEVELTEPSLFFAHSEGSAQRFAAAIATRL